MSQCLNVSCLAACLRERAARAPAQPSYRKLARAARLGETHPGIRSPVARPKIRISAPQRPKCHLSATEAGRHSREFAARGKFLNSSPQDAKRRLRRGCRTSCALAAAGAAAAARASGGAAREDLGIAWLPLVPRSYAWT